MEEIIRFMIPKSNRSVLGHGEAVAAYILCESYRLPSNILGFSGARGVRIGP
jgi:hypothetical protein